MIHKFLCFGRSKKHSSSSKKPYPSVIEELCHHFSLADLKKATNNFNENQVIGKVVFGRVYKGCLQLDHDRVATTAVAMKVRSNKFSVQGSKEFKSEIELLCQLRHPNLISLIGFCIDNDEQIIVYEYMSNGSLHDHLFKSKALSWKKRLEICIGAARAVHYLHSGARRMVIHCDIKPSNVLLDENMVPKLTNFGLSLQGSLSTEKTKPIEGKGVAGTYGYAAPEYIRTGTITYQCDVYSFGVVLLQVVCAQSIRTIMKNGQQQRYGKIEMSSNIMLKLQAEDIDPALRGNIAPECYAVYIDIIERCLKGEPNERPTMGEVEVLLEHALTLQREADNARDTSSIIQPQQEDFAISN